MKKKIKTVHRNNCNNDHKAEAAILNLTFCLPTLFTKWRIQKWRAQLNMDAQQTYLTRVIITFCQGICYSSNYFGFLEYLL